MNAKNIISAILMVLSFTACTSEIEGIDDNMTNTNVSNGTTSISVRMMTEEVSTKGDTSSDESAIKNYVIAVFEEESNQRVGYAFGSTTGGYEETPKTVTEIDAKAGNVTVIVVANVDDTSVFDNLYTYNGFTSMTVGSLNNLTKVGIKTNVTLSAANNSLDVTLKQLTARVNVTLNEPEVTGGNNVTVNFKAYRYIASIAETSMIVYAPQTVETNTEVSLNNETSFSYITYAVATPVLNVYAELEILVDGVVTKTIEKEIPVSFKSQNNVQVGGLIAGKSYSQQVNTKITISQNVDVSFKYEIVSITDNDNQNITYN